MLIDYELFYSTTRHETATNSPPFPLRYGRPRQQRHRHLPLTLTLALASTPNSSTLTSDGQTIEENLGSLIAFTDLRGSHGGRETYSWSLFHALFSCRTVFHGIGSDASAGVSSNLSFFLGFLTGDVGPNFCRFIQIFSIMITLSSTTLAS